eukprot:4949378-Prorocentrum_lima.AAC.1
MVFAKLSRDYDNTMLCSIAESDVHHIYLHIKCMPWGGSWDKSPGRRPIKETRERAPASPR